MDLAEKLASRDPLFEDVLERLFDHLLVLLHNKVARLAQLQHLHEVVVLGELPSPVSRVQRNQSLFKASVEVFLAQLALKVLLTSHSSIEIVNLSLFDEAQGLVPDSNHSALNLEVFILEHVDEYFTLLLSRSTLLFKCLSESEEL